MGILSAHFGYVSCWSRLFRLILSMLCYGVLCIAVCLARTAHTVSIHLDISFYHQIRNRRNQSTFHLCARSLFTAQGELLRDIANSNTLFSALDSFCFVLLGLKLCALAILVDVMFFFRMKYYHSAWAFMTFAENDSSQMRLSTLNSRGLSRIARSVFVLSSSF